MMCARLRCSHSTVKRGQDDGIIGGGTHSMPDDVIVGDGEPQV